MAITGYVTKTLPEIFAKARRGAISKAEKWTPSVRRLLLAGLALAIVRDPSLFYSPRFWAEEGNVFFVYAKTHSWVDVLTQVQFGYFNLANNLASLAAASLPLEFAPTATMIFSLAGLLFGVGAIASLDGRCFDANRKWFFFSLYFVVLPSSEIWMTTISLQSYFFATAFLIGLAELPKTNAKKYLCRFSLALTALCGPYGFLLAPAFVARAWQERSRERWTQAALLAAAAPVQAFFFYKSYLAGASTVTDRFDVVSSLKCFFPILFLKSFALPLGGPATAHFLGMACERVLHVSLACAIALSGCLALVCLAVFISIWRRAPKDMRSYAASAFALLFVAVAFFSRGNKYPYLKTFGGGRYFYATGFVLYSAVFCVAIGKSSKAARIARAATALLLFWSVLSYWHFMPTGPAWREEVRLYRQDPSHKLRIWPEGWVLDLSGAAQD